MNMGRSFSKFTSWCGLILFISIVTLQCFDITELSDTVRDDLIAKRGDTARSVNSTTTQSTHAELSKYILVYIKGSTSIAFLFFFPPNLSSYFLLFLWLCPFNHLVPQAYFKYSMIIIFDANCNLVFVLIYVIKCLQVILKYVQKG